MLIFLFLQYWDIDKPLVGWAKTIFCHCFFDRKIFFIDVPPMNCYNNAIFYRTIETIHRWIGRTDTNLKVFRVLFGLIMALNLYQRFWMNGLIVMVLSLILFALVNLL